jgi:hypothetical protein
LYAELEINSAWETIRDNIKISARESLGYFELKRQKPWFVEGCSKLLDQRKQAKLQWLQDPSEINGNNLNNVRCEVGTYFRNKKREYLKDKTFGFHKILGKILSGFALGGLSNSAQLHRVS